MSLRKYGSEGVFHVNSLITRYCEEYVKSMVDTQGLKFSYQYSSRMNNQSENS